MPVLLELKLLPLDGIYAVCQLPPDAPLPAWAAGGEFVSTTWTGDELSVVCLEASVPAGVKHVGGWRAVRLAGQFPFETTGVVSSLVAPLAEAGIGVFVISTFDTDYLLLPGANFDQALAVLRAAGHEIARSPALNAGS